MWRTLAIAAIAIVPAAAHADEINEGQSATLAAFAKKQFGGESSLSLVPELRLAFAHEGNFVELLANGEAGQHAIENRMEDASLHVAANAGHESAGGSLIAIETEYTFARNFDPDFSPIFAAIETSNSLGLNLHLKSETKAAALDFNAGLSAKLNSDLDRIGFSDVAQQHRDHLDPEVALRATLHPDNAISPFVELAYVGRRYAQDLDLLGRNRNFDGAEAILGFTFNGKNFEGDLGVISYVRHHAEPGLEDVIIASPYVDVTWRPGPRTSISVAALADLAQQATGSPQSTVTAGATLSIAHHLSDTLTATAGLELALEDMSTPDQSLTLSPSLQFAWDVSSNVTLIAKGGADYEDPSHGKFALSGQAALGIKLTAH